MYSKVHRNPVFCLDKGKQACSRHLCRCLDRIDIRQTGLSRQSFCETENKL